MFEKIKKLYGSLLKMERFTQSVSDKLSRLSEIDRKLDKLIELNSMTDTDIEQAISKVMELSDNHARTKSNFVTDAGIGKKIDKSSILAPNERIISKAALEKTRKEMDSVLKELCNTANDYEPVKSLPQRRMEFFKKAFESEFIYSELESKYQSEFNEKTRNFYKTIREFGSLLGYQFERQDTAVTKYKPIRVNE